MLSVVFSNGLDPLMDTLIARVAAARATHDESPLEPVRIIIPNRTVSAFVKLEMAARAGIAANLKLSFLERFLGDSLGPESLRTTKSGPKSDARTSPANPTIVDGDTLVLLILEIFHDERAMSDPSLAPVREYVEGGGDDAETRDVRRFQLAVELARLFREYRLTRRDMLQAWPHRAVLAGTTSASVETWQRALFRRLLSRIGPGGQLALLPDAIERVAPEALALPRHVHVFGVTLLSPTHVDLLRRIGLRTEVNVYALNPCQEYWGDTASVDTPALTLWGRPGRATVHALNEAVEFDFEARFTPPVEERSVLDAIKNDVLQGRAETGDPREASITEPGIVVWACPGARRELEAVAAEIWSQVRQSSSLSFRDIAVVLMGRERESYGAHVSAVFAESHGIPHHFHEVPIRASSRIVEAIELLLALPTSAFTRQDLLRILLHPAIGAQDGIDTNEWLRWLDTLSVVHGRDHQDHANTYIEQDIYNWDQGMRRLVLGAAMSGERSGDDRAFVIGEEHYYPLEHAVDRAGSAMRIVSLVRSLIADARAIRHAEMRVGPWMELIRTLVTSYVRAESDGDGRDLESCLSAIQDLALADQVETKISFSIAARLVSTALARLKVGRGQPLADGVAVGPLSALATIPFSTVFLVGLGEGQFPASEIRTQLDLRSEGRKPWDVSSKEEDEYLFLLRLLATRDRVYLSYVSREARTGDRLEPSSIVLELIQAAEKRGDRIERIEHPLRRFDPRAFSGTAIPSTPARRERAVRRLREALVELVRARSGPDAPFPDLPTLRRALTPNALEPLSERLGLCPLPPISRGRAMDDVQQVPLWVLRDFLKDPREAWTKRVLGLHGADTEEDPLAREDEAFDTEPLQSTILLRTIFYERLRHPEVHDDMAFFEARYDERMEPLVRRGILPAGVFGQAERARHLEILGKWSNDLREHYAGELALEEGLRFGRSKEDQHTGELLDPIVLDVELSDPGGVTRTIKAEITGQTTPTLSSATTLVLSIGKRPSDGSLLNAFIDQVAIAALGRGNPKNQLVLIFSAATAPMMARFAPISREEALEYLGILVHDLLDDSHAYDLPLDSVFGVKTSQTQAEADVTWTLPESEPPEANARQRMIERRFGLFFAKKDRGRA